MQLTQSTQPIENYASDTPVAHLVEFAGRVFLARHNICNNRWYGIATAGLDLVEGAEPADVCVPHKTVSWSSVSAAKRHLRDEFGFDTGFIVVQAPEKKFE
jgi:hypothetical protein